LHFRTLHVEHCHEALRSDGGLEKVFLLQSEEMKFV
jgi:hypothetical protein